MPISEGGVSQAEGTAGRERKDWERDHHGPRLTTLTNLSLIPSPAGDLYLLHNMHVRK